MKSFSGLKKVAGIGEFQDGRQNGRRALSDSLSRFIIELVLGLRGVPCAICPLILTSDPCRGPIGDLKKTWVDIPNVEQKAVIQYGVQDGRRTLIPNMTPSGFVLECYIWCLYPGFGGRGIQ